VKGSALRVAEHDPQVFKIEAGLKEQIVKVGPAGWCFCRSENGEEDRLRSRGGVFFILITSGGGEAKLRGGGIRKIAEECVRRWEEILQRGGKDW